MILYEFWVIMKKKKPWFGKQTIKYFFDKYKPVLVYPQIKISSTKLYNCPIDYKNKKKKKKPVQIQMYFCLEKT